jgi:hypothetical protein
MTDHKKPNRPPALKPFRVRFQEITCYALDVTAKSEGDAIFLASEKFYRLSLADRADAIIDDGSLDYFEAEEGGVQ